MKKRYAAVLFIILAVFIAFVSCSESDARGANSQLGHRFKLNEERLENYKFSKEFTGYLNSLGYTEVVSTKSVTITASDPLDVARYGSAVSFTATATVETSSYPQTVITLSGITIDTSASDGIKKLTDNTVALTSDTHSTVAVSVGSYTRIFDYDIVQQSVSYDNLLVLVNKISRIGSDYAPPDLVYTKDNVYGNSGTVSKMRKEAADALQEMIEAAEKAGYDLTLLSAYRPYDMQQRLYNNAGGANQNGTAAPGASEHQTGLCADICWYHSGTRVGISQSMQTHAEYKWLIENSYKYGFIIRYPKGYDDVTGYKFEPWHYRYLGKEAAHPGRKCLR